MLTFVQRDDVVLVCDAGGGTTVRQAPHSPILC